MSDFSVIIPAAGQSSRFQGHRRKKPFVDLDGRAIWLRTVEHFVNRDDVSEVVLVLAADDLAEFRERFRPNLAFLDLTIAEGGASRAESVQNGLSALSKPCDFVAVHDAARPLLTAEWISELFAAARSKDAVLPGTAISSTIKRVSAESVVKETVDRTNLFLAQTPQAFRRAILEESYASVDVTSDFTDEASLVESLGHEVHIHPGWPMNIKITTNDDFDLAKLFIKALPKAAGLKSLHPFADDR